MRHLTFALLFTALAVTGVTLAGRGEDPKKADEQKPDPKKVKELMHRKLEYSQKLLEALALNDLDKAAKSAEDLIRVRKEITWKVVKTPEYEIWSDEFERSAKSVVKAAKDKNLEEAKLNYLGMTLSCFHCHTYVRDLGRVSVEDHTGP
jgi:hypothetical protein